MNIEIKISKKPVDYRKAIIFMEKRLDKIREGKARELIWILEHNDIYTAGSRSKKNEILDKKIKVMKTNRGGKITWHGKGQLICYFVINLNKRNKDIRKFITNIENSIINTLKEFEINSASLLAILSVTTLMNSLLNSKFTFLSFIFFIKVINLSHNL